MTIIRQSHSIRMNVNPVRNQSVVRSLRLHLRSEGANHSWVSVVHLRHRAECSYISRAISTECLSRCSLEEMSNPSRSSSDCFRGEVHRSVTASTLAQQHGLNTAHKHSRVPHRHSHATLRSRCHTFQDSVHIRRRSYDFDTRLVQCCCAVDFLPRVDTFSRFKKV